MSDEYKTRNERDLEEARKRLSDLFAAKEELDVEIAKQQHRVAALSVLADESEESDRGVDLNLGGLTDAIRGVLRAAGPNGLTPKEIRKRLIQLYFPVNEYKNFMASLHSVLNRLVKAKQAKEANLAIVESGDRRERVVYQWIQKFQGRYQGRYFGNRFNEGRLNKGRFNRGE